MKEVFASFERLFGISILIADNQISDCPYTHSFDINQWKDVLRAMEKTCPLKVSETSPGNFVVSGQCCSQTN
jgi:hypothetical protein